MSHEPYSDTEMMAAFRVMQTFRMSPQSKPLVWRFEQVLKDSLVEYRLAGQDRWHRTVLESHGALVKSLHQLLTAKVAFERGDANEDTLHAATCGVLDAAQALQDSVPETLKSYMLTGHDLADALDEMLKQMDGPIRNHQELHARQVEAMRAKSAALPKITQKDLSPKAFTMNKDGAANKSKVRSK